MQLADIPGRTHPIVRPLNLAQTFDLPRSGLTNIKGNTHQQEQIDENYFYVNGQQTSPKNIILNTDIISSYILDTFNNIYEVPSSLTIAYGDEKNADIIVKKGNISFFETANSLPENFAWDEWNDQRLPLPFDDDRVDQIITTSEKQIIINYDIFAASFYFLSGWQEIHQTETDSFCRFPYESSFQKKYDLILVPVVNYYFEILKTAIEQHLDTTIQRKHSQAPFTAFLSHDIDQVHSGWIQDSKYALKNGKPQEAAAILSKRLSNVKDEWHNLDVIVELEKMLGVVSSFYILAKKSEDNADYLVEDVEPYFDMIEEAGSEIGVHGSLGSGFDGRMLKKEIAALGRPVTGNRYHFLRNNVKITPYILDDAGMEYDSSLCFDDHIGFRNGFCFPFRPFNFATQKPFRHLQIPLLIMDSTLKVDDYMGTIPYPRKKEMINHIINQVEHFGGVITILWHNSFFTNHKYSGWGARYVQIVKDLKEKQAEFLTGKQIAERY